MLNNIYLFVVNKQSDSKSTNFFIYVLSIIFAFIVFSISWVCDDAYHSFIMAQNLNNGYGFVYNLGYRVNATTCPFFTLLVALIDIFVKDMFLTAIIIGVFFSTLTFFVLLKMICKSNFECFLLFICLLSSYSFMSFTTSGLENSALYFFVSIIAVIYFKSNEEHISLKKLFFFSFCLGCLLGTRMDNVLIVFPLFLHLFLQTKQKIYKKLLICISGVSPFIIWLLFSTWYYGFPFPNTAYAKLNTGFNLFDYLYRGVDYVGRSLICDLAILSSFVVLISVVIIKKNVKIYVAGSGILFYILYVVYIGGDFMVGRHLTVIYLLSVIMIFLSINFQISRIIFFSCILVTAFSVVYNFSLRNFINVFFYTNNYKCHLTTSVTDEKDFYYTFNIYNYLYNKIFFKKDLNKPTLNENILTNGVKSIILKRFSWGRLTYYLKQEYPNVMVVDMIGLSDELLSRLPAYDNNWRVGHMIRIFPKGYIKTLLTGYNFIENKEIHKYYDNLNLIVSGDLLDFERLKIIFRFNLESHRLPTSAIYEWEEFIDKAEIENLCPISQDTTKS